MKKRYQKFLNIIICLLLSFVFFSITIHATEIVDNKENKVTLIGEASNDDATYGVASTEEEKTLEFGLKYRFDKGYVNTTDASEISSDMYACGGSSYKSSGKMLANTYYPADVRILEIDPSLGLEIVPWVKFKNGKWTLNTVLSMASDYEASHPGYKVVGAINADFFDISSTHNYNYTTTGGTVTEGNYYKVSSTWNTIGFKDGTLYGNIKPTISEKPILEIFDDNNNILYSCNVDKINEEPTGAETSVYMAFYSEEHKAVPVDVTNAYIVSTTINIPFSESSIYGYGTFNSYQTSYTIDNTSFAIKTSNQSLKDALKENVKVRVQYTYTNELEGVDYCVGYKQNILVNSECVAPTDYRHPRTIIGKKADGTIVMAEVDGRQASINCYGCTLKEEAALMAYYGCTEAYNLDGGGSSTICIIEDGALTIQNSTSDGGARNDSNCLLIVAKVPVLSVETNEVKTSEISLTVDVETTIETYKDLYIYFDTDKEYKKIESGKKITLTNLTKNTKYTYQIYAKVKNDYVLIPYSGVITTCKDKYTMENLKATIVVDKDVETIQISFDLTDIDTTIVTSVLIIDGKRYYKKNGVFKVPMSELSPFTTKAQIEITYNVNDGKGSVTDTLKVNATIDSSSILFSSVMDESTLLFNQLFE